ncbi:hypothetical protein EDD76_107248 [Kineothrix alysoides]|uniref:Lysine-N-methylase n=1 Tax=Kineothrix alysoides TaxID=1469948 RepID=A0A4R1QYT4_9FIRM|nr:flagellin lysine-N-methylase [Kineothrix alysoides]TCL58132.1 hypothetical protein EDD76_107248 [Kineothrix alysoides]
MHVLKPSFYDDFTCIGKDCLFTCCQGWSVPIEEDVYQRLVTDSSQLSELAKSHIVYNKELERYQFKFIEGMCPFCNKDQLCNMVIEEGEEILGSTCRTFPRHSTIIGQTEEKYLTLACPAVVEFLFSIQGPLSFVMEEDDKGEKGDTGELYEIIELDVEIRNCVIDILQNRNFPLWFRQFVCVYSMDRIKEIHREGNRGLIIKELSHIWSPFYLEELLKEVGSIQEDKNNGFKQLCQLFSDFQDVAMILANEDMRGSRGKVEELIKCNHNCSWENYEKAYVLWEQREAANFDILMEHATVCSWFWYALKEMNRYYLLDNSYIIILEQLLIKHLTILYYCLHQEISKEMQEFIISLCARMISHRRADMEQVIKRMKKEGRISVAHVLLLLK